MAKASTFQINLLISLIKYVSGLSLIIFSNVLDNFYILAEESLLHAGQTMLWRSLFYFYF